MLLPFVLFWRSVLTTHLFLLFPSAHTGITVLEEGTDNVVGHYNFRQVGCTARPDARPLTAFWQIPDFHVGDRRENFYFTYDGPNGREKHEFKTKDALNMIGKATAFVDKLVAQQRQASEKAASRPDLEYDAAAALRRTANRHSYAHPEKWSKEDVATWLSSKGLKQAFIANFLSNDIDGEALKDVDNDDLAGMGIKKEENQRKLLKSIKVTGRRAVCARTLTNGARRNYTKRRDPKPRHCRPCGATNK